MKLGCMVCLIEEVSKETDILCNRCKRRFPDYSMDIDEILKSPPSIAKSTEVARIVDDLHNIYKNGQDCELCGNFGEITNFKYNLLVCNNCDRNGDFTEQIEKGYNESNPNPKSPWSL